MSISRLLTLLFPCLLYICSWSLAAVFWRVEFEIRDMDTFWWCETGNTLLLWQWEAGVTKGKVALSGEERDSELTELLPRLFKQNKKASGTKARKKYWFSRGSLRIVSKPGTKYLFCWFGIAESTGDDKGPYTNFQRKESFSAGSNGQTTNREEGSSGLLQTLRKYGMCRVSPNLTRLLCVIKGWPFAGNNAHLGWQTWAKHILWSSVFACPEADRRTGDSNLFLYCFSSAWLADRRLGLFQ